MFAVTSRLILAHVVNMTILETDISGIFITSKLAEWTNNMSVMA